MLYIHGRIHLLGPNRDITDKTAENFSGHLVAPDPEFGGIFARLMHLNGTPYKHPTKTVVQQQYNLCCFNCNVSNRDITDKLRK